MCVKLHIINIYPVWNQCIFPYAIPLVVTDLSDKLMLLQKMHGLWNWVEWQTRAFCGGWNCCYWKSFQVFKYYKKTLWRTTDLCKAISDTCDNLLILHQNVRNLFCRMSNSISKELNPTDITTTVSSVKQVEIFILIIVKKYSDMHIMVCPSNGVS